MKVSQKTKTAPHRIKAKRLAWGDLFDATYRASQEEGVPKFSSGSAHRLAGINSEL